MKNKRTSIYLPDELYSQILSLINKGDSERNSFNLVCLELLKHGLARKEKIDEISMLDKQLFFLRNAVTKYINYSLPFFKMIELVFKYIKKNEPDNEDFDLDFDEIKKISEMKYYHEKKD